MKVRAFNALERLIEPLVAGPATQPPRLVPFLAQQLVQVRGLLLGVFALSALDALVDTLIPYFIGRLVDALSQTPREQFLAVHGPMLVVMLGVMLLRPLIISAAAALAQVGIAPGFQTRLRWQYFSRLVSQSLGFFQNDFAGRLANRVMQTGGAVRMAALSVLQVILYVTFYVVGSLGLVLAQDWRLALPILTWLVLYGLTLRHFLPEQRRRAQAASDARSSLMGKVVDAFGNIQTLKLFGARTREDAYMGAAFLKANAAFQHQQRLSVGLTLALSLLSMTTITATAALGLWLWSGGVIEVGAFAMTMALVTSLSRMAGWIAWEISGIMENIGIVQEGMESITAPLTLQDAPDAVPLKLSRGEITIEDLHFSYDSRLPVLAGVSLTIRPGEKIGLVGRSGAGKSTLVSLLLHFNRPQSGVIRIDGQDIATLTQESLRQQIAMVTQDTALLHRSIRDNILYGRPEASEADLRAALRQAHAEDFIEDLIDWKGRRGLDAHVGERGVKLSGGQRQRIAMARVILKNAPVLVLDEATSALDSEVEAAIQDSLVGVMTGKTVIAIAHRLSTLRIMDRLVVLDHGKIEEVGSHADLLARGGLYAQLWSRQSGGFVDDSPKTQPVAPF